MNNKKLKIMAVLGLMSMYTGIGFAITGLTGFEPVIIYIGMMLLTAGMFAMMCTIMWYENESKTESEIKAIILELQSELRACESVIKELQKKLKNKRRK